ncbi:MAG: hypothetical protein AAGA96_18445 [Verrucomicrobiota bacterium]
MKNNRADSGPYWWKVILVESAILVSHIHNQEQSFDSICDLDPCSVWGMSNNCAVNHIADFKSPSAIHLFAERLGCGARYMTPDDF